MNENELKQLAQSLIAECSADTLASLQNALKTAQNDDTGGTLNELVAVSGVAVELQAQQAKQPAEPKTFSEALALRKAKK